MENLSKVEMIEINGGSSFQAITIHSSSDSLLSLTFERNYGSHHSITEISAGNDIEFNFGLNTKRN